MTKKDLQKTIKGKMTRVNYAAFGAAILGIGILHFLMQMSIIQFENRRMIEESVKVAPATETVSQPNWQELAIEKKSGEIMTIEADSVVVAKPENFVHRDLIPQKISHAETLRPSSELLRKVERKTVKDVEKPLKDGKKKVSRQVDGERLRRAEQLLTGF